MVSFNQIQPDYKLPGVAIEVDPSQAGTPVNLKFGLLAGHRLTSGQAASNLPIACASEMDAAILFGQGSMLFAMFRRAFGINRTTPFFCLPIAEPAAGVAATGTVTVSAAPSVAGTLALYVAGQKVPVLVGSADTTAQVATKIAAAINALTTLPVTAAAAAAVVTLTAKWKGLTGNDIRIEDSYRGLNGGEQLPAGLALAYSGSGFLTGGTGTPDLTTAIANMGDDPWKFAALPWTDSGSFSLFDLEYGFTDSGRWGWIRQAYGQVFSARRDTYAGHMVWGPTNNSAVIYPMALEVESPTPVWEWAAAYCAQAARAFTLDPARPLQTLPLTGCLPAPRGKRFNKTQLNAMAKVGLSIQGTDLDGNTGGVPQIQREQSSYQRNSYGLADNAFELATTLATLDVIFTRLRQSVTNKHPRDKLANDGTRPGSGQAILTPKAAKSELVAEYRIMESEGLVENVEAFKAALVCERSAVDPTTLEVVYPPDLINGLRRFNVRAAFRLQFPTAIAA